jgi:hypothetical protein
MTTIENLLATDKGMKSFRTFLRKERADENLDCLLMARAAVRSPDHARFFLAPMYSEFVSPTAPRQVNLSHVTQRNFASVVHRESTKREVTILYHEVMAITMSLLRDGPFIRYLQSPLCDM